MTAWDLYVHVPVIAVYYVSPTQAIPYYEMHAGGAYGMDKSAHRNLHLTRGTQLLSGCVSNPTADTAVSVAPTLLEFTSGRIADEDIQVNTDAVTTSIYTVYRYLNGFWEYNVVPQGVPFYNNATDPTYVPSPFTTVTPITNNGRYFNYWAVGVPVLTGHQPQIMLIAGQILHTNLANAVAATFTSDVTNFNQLTTEGVILYRVVLQRLSGGSSVINTRLMEVDKINQSFAVQAVAVSTIATGVNTDVSGFANVLTSSQTNVQLALNKIDTDVYTKTSVNTALGLKQDTIANADKIVKSNATNYVLETYAAPVVHTHDDRYFTETEVTTTYRTAASQNTIDNARVLNSQIDVSYDSSKVFYTHDVSKLFQTNTTGQTITGWSERGDLVAALNDM